MSLNACLYVAESVPYESLKEFILKRGGWETQGNSQRTVDFFLPFSSGHAHVFIEFTYKHEIFDATDVVYLKRIKDKLGAEPTMCIDFDFSTETDPQAYYELAYDFCRKWPAIFENVPEELLSCEQVLKKLELPDE